MKHGRMKERAVDLKTVAVLLAILVAVARGGVAWGVECVTCHSCDISSTLEDEVPLVLCPADGQFRYNVDGSNFSGGRKCLGADDQKGDNLLLGARDNNFRLVGPAQAEAATYYVPDDFTSIQEAIDATGDGDEIIVRDGTYYERIDFLGKAISVRSENGSSTTIIDGVGNDIGAVVVFWNGEGENSVLDGFTITNGVYNFGGGISAMENSPTILNCVITGNTAAYGGGIFDYGPSGATITSCIIVNNTAVGYGGGVYTVAGAITSCTISDNMASEEGGGISIVGWGDHGISAIMTNCIISDNTAGDGGGIRCFHLSPMIINCTIYSNAATNTYGGGILCYEGYGPTVVNSILWHNTAGGSPNEIYLGGGATIDITYSDIKGGWTGAGNIDSDPLFIDPGYRDFHLQSGSSCIDAGNNDAPEFPGIDFEGDPRTVDDPSTPDTGNGIPPVVDMGVDELAPSVLRALFSGDPTAGTKPLTVQFTDHSTGSPAAWSWDFGDAGTSTSQNPSHTYTIEGDFTVSLTVTDTVQDTAAKTGYIHVVPPPVADFTADATTGFKPLTINFTDQSTGSPAAWSWDFGDTETSTQQNPSHTYDDAGDFTVSLTVTGPGGEDTEIKENYIHVSMLCECAMVPDNPEPIIIPRGGTLGFQATVTNNTDKTGDVLFATNTILPGGSVYPASGFLLGPFTVSLTPGGSQSGHLSQPIPIGAPEGTYIYRGIVGRYDLGILHRCHLEFEVVAP